MIRFIALALLLSLTPVSGLTQDRVVKGPAIVKDDGTLSVGRQRFALYGIDFAPFGRDCRTFETPPRCGDRVTLILESLIEGFVHCHPITRGSAICTIAGRRMLDDRIDVAEKLLLEGLAFARPEAPARYHRWQDVAKTRKAGIWGNNFIDIR